MAARPKDIATKMDVKASSVTNALKTLAGLGLINYAPYDFVTLTDSGRKVAQEINRRHHALKDFLINVLGIENKEADEAACQMEHSVPKRIVNRLIKYAEYVEHCPKGGITWESGFGYYCKNGCSEEDCERHRPEKDSE